MGHYAVDGKTERLGGPLLEEGQCFVPSVGCEVRRGFGPSAAPSLFTYLAPFYSLGFGLISLLSVSILEHNLHEEREIVFCFPLR